LGYPHDYGKPQICDGEIAMFHGKIMGFLRMETSEFRPKPQRFVFFSPVLQHRRQRDAQEDEKTCGPIEIYNGIYGGENI
jgi:hypothetical protein